MKGITWQSVGEVNIYAPLPDLKWTGMPATSGSSAKEAFLPTGSAIGYSWKEASQRWPEPHPPNEAIIPITQVTVRSYRERAHEVQGQVHGSLVHDSASSSATGGRVRDRRGKEWLPQSLSLNPDFFLFPFNFSFSQMVAISMTFRRQAAIPKPRQSVC